MGVHLQIVIQIEGSDSVARFRVWPFMLAISGNREVDTTSLLLRVPFILDHCLMTFFCLICKEEDITFCLCPVVF